MPKYIVLFENNGEFQTAETLAEVRGHIRDYLDNYGRDDADYRIRDLSVYEIGVEVPVSIEDRDVEIILGKDDFTPSRDDGESIHDYALRLLKSSEG